MIKETDEEIKQTICPGEAFQILKDPHQEHAGRRVRRRTATSVRSEVKMVAGINLRYVAAPMVNQSDMPFRLLVRRHGATVSYTQMYNPDRLLNDQEYLDYHIRDLTLGSDDHLSHPIVAQLCGNDPDLIVQAGRKLQGHCDAIDLNLGCPQEVARDGHYGAYLLGHKDWPIVENIVSAMSQSFTVPVSAKLRLCQPPPKTADFAQRLEVAGASWIALHARTVSARRRRQGAANLEEVARLKKHLRIPVISNGNVRIFDDLQANLHFTGADGLMVGETLLGNPCIFSGAELPDAVEISLEYLSLCKQYPGTNLSHVKTHVRHILEFKSGKKSWLPRFREALAAASSLDAIENLLRFKVERWRGRPPRKADVKGDQPDDIESDDDVIREAEEDVCLDLEALAFPG